MAITTLTNNNSPVHVNNAALQTAITAQTTLVNSLTNGSANRNAAQQRLDLLKREFCYALIASNQINPDAIINNLTYGQQS